MDAWTSTAQALALFFQQYGLVVVTLLLFLKSAGLPVPLPGDLLMLVIGSIAVQQGVPLGIAWVAFSVATFGGAMVLFSMIRRAGRGRVSHFGRYVGLTDERIEQAEVQIRARGWWAVAIGRVVPGVRLATAVAAATFKVHPSTFASAAAVSAVVEVGVCLVVGATIGPSIAQRLDQVSLPVAQLIVAMIVLIAIVAVAHFALTLSRRRVHLSRD